MNVLQPLNSKVRSIDMTLVMKRMMQEGLSHEMHANAHCCDLKTMPEGKAVLVVWLLAADPGR